GAADDRRGVGAAFGGVELGLAPGADAFKDVPDHAFEAHFHAVLGAIDFFDAVGFELGAFVRHDGAAAADHHANMLRPTVAQHIDHVFEVFHVAALVGADGDAVGIF